jgi:hypothetical protein
MGRRSRIGLVVVVLSVLAFAERNAFAQQMLTFTPRHRVRETTAVLSPALARAIDSQKSISTISRPEDLIAFGLKTTSSALHFGLSHHTHLTFDENDREGNCVEYAELFAAIVNREHGSIEAHAFVVRSDAKIMGRTMSDPAWKDHDWVLLVVRTATKSSRFYVDPTLHDMGLGWNISNAVQGEVSIR